MYRSINRKHDVTNSLNDSQPPNLWDDMFINDITTFSTDTNKGRYYRKKIRYIIKSSASSQQDK